MAGSTPAAASRGASELALRWLSAILLGPPVLALCWLGGWWLAAAVALASGLSAYEIYRLASAKGLPAHSGLGVAAAAAFPLLLHAGGASLTAGALTLLVLAALLVQLVRQQVDQAIVTVAVTTFGAAYTGWLLAHAVSVRSIAQDPWLAGSSLPDDSGSFFLILALISIVGSDAGAYFAGKALGRRKLAPRISPGKTVEGALGGIVAGALLAVACKYAFEWLPGDLSRSLSAPVALAVGAVLAVAAEIGDLLESMLKRDAHVKDAGHLIPGVGGVLDRVDSALVGLPVMYYLLLALYCPEAS